MAASITYRSRVPPSLRVKTSRVPRCDSAGSASWRTTVVAGLVRLRTAPVARSMRRMNDSPVRVETLVTNTALPSGETRGR